MKILRITDSPLSPKETNALNDYGIIVSDSSPTLLSALTAMKISRKADQWTPDAVIAYRQADALAAISAKKIAKHNTYKIIYVMEPNSTQPPKIHKPVVEEVDAWIFKSERLYELYGENSDKCGSPQKSLRKIYLLAPTPLIQTSAQKPDIAKRPIVIARIGPITDTERLKKMLDKVDDLNGEFVLRISGGGNARDVMPAVRYARALQHADKVVWVGEEYDKDKEIESCSAAVASAEDITYIESEVLQSGRKLLQTDEIGEFLSSPTIGQQEDEYNSEKYKERLRNILSEIINS